MLEAAKLLRGLDKLDLIKIDVEGHELPILRSIEPELRRFRPRAILFEDQTESSELRHILRRCGYSVFGIKKTLFKTQLVEGLSGVNDHLAVLR